MALLRHRFTASLLHRHHQARLLTTIPAPADANNKPGNGADASKSSDAKVGESVVPSRRVKWSMGAAQQPEPEDRTSTLWPGMYHSPVTAALWQARASIRERDGTTAAAGAATELMRRTPAMSRTTVSYGLASDPILREQYRNPWNGCRIGKLLEDLDALAGTIAMKV